jgi:mercuric ion binding protein
MNIQKLVAAVAACALFSVAASAGTIEMKVYGLVCGFCAQGIEKTLRKNPATADVVVSLENKLVAIGTRDGQDISDADLTKALTDAGYDVKAISRTQRSIAEIRASIKGSAK